VSDGLNLGADWEQSKRLLQHWHDMWAKVTAERDRLQAEQKDLYDLRRLHERTASKMSAYIARLEARLREALMSEFDDNFEHGRVDLKKDYHGSQQMFVDAEMEKLK